MRRQVDDFEEELADRLLGSDRGLRGVAGCSGFGSDALGPTAVLSDDAQDSFAEGRQSNDVHRELSMLSGHCHGLSSELQVQARRLEQVAQNLFEWRDRLESDLQERLSELEVQRELHDWRARLESDLNKKYGDLSAAQQQMSAAQQQMGSALRLAGATSDDFFERLDQRVRRLEGLEGQEPWQPLARQVEAVDSRLRELETARMMELSVSTCTAFQTPGRTVGDSAPQSSRERREEAMALAETAAAERLDLEARLGEMRSKIDSAGAQANEMQTRVEAQEERLRSLRTMTEMSEAHVRETRQQLLEWEKTARELQALAGELGRSGRESGEALSLLQRRVDAQEAAREEVREELDRLRERCAPILERPFEVSSISAGPPSRPHTPVLPMRPEEPRLLAEVQGRLGAVEAAMETMAGTMEALQVAGQLYSTSEPRPSPCVASMAVSLSKLVPRVMEQERVVSDLSEHFRELNVRVNMALNFSKAFVAEPLGSGTSAKRLKWLEAEVSHLKELVGKTGDWDTLSDAAGSSETHIGPDG